MVSFHRKSLKKIFISPVKRLPTKEFKGSSTVKVIEKTNDVQNPDKTQFVCNVTRTTIYIFNKGVEIDII